MPEGVYHFHQGGKLPASDWVDCFMFRSPFVVPQKTDLGFKSK